ncbi:PREDICTED: uncharacterized protein LOC106750967 [Dinoponera quadriceps]|uniref:Uncharacterized protein LOC106750967 n=1 Tax=Dinoponera quadriceps TaxID=609295 RepID=A0A6P3Y8D8_DINQU|nr:PREDICTED: uncharacterized protein LOC106750967 [Dinoponera quadriceps]
MRCNKGFLRRIVAKQSLKQLSHQELIQLTKVAIDNVIESDPLFSTLFLESYDRRTYITDQELIRLTKVAETKVEYIIESDPLLSGLLSNVRIEELTSQIDVAQGQAITLFQNHRELPKLVVVLPRDKTVFDLKKTMERHMCLSFVRENVRKVLPSDRTVLDLEKVVVRRLSCVF